MKARLALALALVVPLACSDDDSQDPCKPDDQDGLIGIDVSIAVSVTDQGFEPAIIKTQNRSNLTLTLTNNGTKAHGFAVDCLATPNQNGCAAQSCFPAEAAVAPVAPGQVATVKFATPAVEGIYTYRTDVAGTGQFILQ